MWDMNTPYRKTGDLTGDSVIYLLYGKLADHTLDKKRY